MSGHEDARDAVLTAFALPDEVEVLDETTVARANEFLALLASGLFPDGQLDPELMTWAERVADPRPAAEQLSIEERLKSAESRFLTLVEQIPAVTFMAVLGEGENDVYVSPHIEQMLGYTQEQWLSDPFLWYYRLHPDDRARWNEEFTRGVRTGGPFRNECRFLARDGHVVWVHGEARLVKDDKGRPQFLQGVAFDITESKRAQEMLLETAVLNARIQEEVAIAHRVQSSLLPRAPQLPGLEIAAKMLPAEDVGGDYYDVRPARDGGWITIGDVSGHGLDAGLVMLMMQSAVSTLTLAREEIAPGELLSLLNATLYDALAHRLLRDEYVTLSVLRYEQNGRITFAGAHQDILVLRASTRRVERVTTPGPWVGIREHIASIAIDSTLQLEPGDVLVLHTDGLTESTDADGELYDIDRMCRSIEDACGRTPAEICDHVLAQVKLWGKQDDDITLFVARYQPLAE